MDATESWNFNKQRWYGFGIGFKLLGE